MGTHKTDWKLLDTVLPEDMNRIEGNIKETERLTNEHIADILKHLSAADRRKLTDALSSVAVGGSSSSANDPAANCILVNGIASGAPSAGFWYILTFTYDAGSTQNLCQIAIKYFRHSSDSTTAGEVRARYRYNGAWSAWTPDVNALITALDTKVNTHLDDKENPHGVTAKQIGAVLLQDFTAHSNESANVHGLGTATLLTSAKTLRESINELFTSVDNGKFGVRSDIIAKGGTVIGAHPNSFNELRNGIMSIPTGIKHARGTFTSASVGAILLNSEGYQVNTNYYDFDFSLLDFIPEFIFFIASNPTVKDGVAVWSHDNILHLSASQYANNIVPSEGAFRTPYSNGVVRIAMQYRSTAYTWYAYGR